MDGYIFERLQKPSCRYDHVIKNNHHIEIRNNKQEKALKDKTKKTRLGRRLRKIKEG